MGNVDSHFRNASFNAQSFWMLYVHAQAVVASFRPRSDHSRRFVKKT